MINLYNFLSYKLNKSYFYKKYIRKSKRLFTSSLISKLITIVSLPLITRLYNPDNFGVYTGFAAIVGIINPIATLRYERAIVITKSKEERLKIVTAAFSITLLISLLVLISIIVCNFFFIRLNNFKEILLTLPIATLIIGIYQPLYYLALLEKQYSLITLSKLKQSIGSFLFHLLLYPIGSIGLIVGYIISNGSGFESLFIKQIKYIKKDFYKKINYIPNTLKRYKDFGLYLTLSSLLSCIGNHLPRLIFLEFFGQTGLGFIGLAIGLYNIPIYLAQNTINTFFICDVNELSSKGLIRKEINQILKNLLLMGIAICLIMNLFMSNMINLLFGEAWSPLANVILLMSPLFVFELISNTLNYVLYPSRKLKISFLFELILASLKIIPLLVGIKLGFSFNQSILVYVIFSCVGYALFIAKIINTSKNKYLITD